MNIYNINKNIYYKNRILSANSANLHKNRVGKNMLTSHWSRRGILHFFPFYFCGQKGYVIHLFLTNIFTARNFPSPFLLLFPPQTPSNYPPNAHKTMLFTFSQNLHKTSIKLHKISTLYSSQLSLISPFHPQLPLILLLILKLSNPKNTHNTIQKLSSVNSNFTLLSL